MQAMPFREPFEEKYEILEKIGQGGMGAVYKVRHRLLDEPRVIKVIRSPLEPTPEAEERFQREARTACRLRHPNVALLHDFALGDDGRAYIVLEHIEGSTLRELLQSLGPPPLPLALEIARQTALALQFLHGRRIVHRDISPGNLMLTRDFQGGPLVKLIDLGLAKSLEGGSGDGLTKGVFLGKVRYAAPEQFDEGAVDERSDLYSFGIVFYELLTGRSPIAGHDPKSWMAAHLFRPPLDFAESDPEGQVPAELRELVLRLLAKDPAARFADAGELLRDLAEIQARFPLRGDEMEGVFASPAPAAPAVEDIEGMGAVALEPEPIEEISEEIEDARPVVLAPSFEPDLERDLERDLEPDLVMVSAARGGLDAPSMSLPLHRFGREEAEEASVSIPLIRGRGAARMDDDGPSWDAPVHRGDHREDHPVDHHPVDRRVFLYEPMDGPEEPEPAMASTRPAQRNGGLLPLLVGVFCLFIIVALIGLFSVTTEFQLGHSEPGDVIVETEPVMPPEEDAEPERVADPEIRPEPGLTAQEIDASAPLIEELGAVEPTPAPEPEPEPATPVRIAEKPRPQPAAPPTRVAPPPAPRREEPVRTVTRESEPEPAERVAQAEPPRRREPPAVREGGVRPGPGVVPPIPLDIPRFSYPAAAKGQGIALDVRVDLLVDERGKVVEAVVREGDAEGLGFNEAALAAARRMSFQPATRGETPVKMWTEMIFQFSETGSGR
jgi:TonB family protein